MSTATDRDEAQPRLAVFLGQPLSGSPGLGGKASQLHELLRAGFPVPKAFCLTTDAFAAFLDETGLGKRLGALDPKQRESFGTAREMVRSATMPAALASAIGAAYEQLGAPVVAVRSSAVGEDSASHSFAGQHDTVLNVRGREAVEAAVLECWASLFSDRAWAYRRGVDGDGLARLRMAVVVQELVPAESAGVIFTTDPVDSKPDRLILEACWGLGEGLVAGRVTTDSFVIDVRDHRIVERQIRYKVMETVPAEGGGSTLAKVPAERRDAPVLTDAQALELAALAMRIRDHYGADQDIEWALRDGRFFILQSRPITTRPRQSSRVDPHIGGVDPKVRERILWSRMDIGEIFTGRMTPLGVTFARHYHDHVHRRCVESLGILYTGEHSEYMGYMHGHVYLNVSYSAYLLSQCPPARDQKQFTVRFSSEEVDLSTYTNPYGEFPSNVNPRAATMHWIKGQVRELVGSARRAREMVASRFAEFDRFRGLDLTRMTIAELHEEMTRDLDYFCRMHYGYMPYYINAFGFYGMIEQACRKWLGEEGRTLQNRLKGDMSNLRTVEGAREVWALAQAARKAPRVEQIIRDNPPEEVARRLRADPAGERFWKESMEPFLRNNGTRGRQEMEITHPRWIDDPAYVFQMIRSYLVNDFSIDDVLERGHKHRTVDSNAILARLPLHRRTLLKLLIKLYSTCSEQREATRMAMITSIWLLRSIVYEVGRRLVEEGVLRSIDEVPFLDFQDILDFLARRGSARELFLRGKIEEARRTHLHYLRTADPPLTFIGYYDPSRRVTIAPDADAIPGLGTSPGRIEGRARVIHDLVRQADEFKPGEILVTTFTDASWTPLFAIAGAVVTDIGSMLSHSSIVSREFNIPSVVNTKIATQRIRTGDHLIVDGDQGLVQIVRS